MPTLIDIGCLCEHHSDATLEFIAKAQGDDPGDAIWDPHPNPLIRQLVEIFTKRGLTRIRGVVDELRRIAGHRAAGKRVPRPAGAMARWSGEELDLVRLYLNSLPVGEYTLDDWMMAVDYVVQRYLPADDMRTDADWLVTRSNMMARVSSAMTAVPSTAQVAQLMAAPLPPSTGMKPAQRTALEFSSARAAENVTAVTDAFRHRIRGIVTDHAEAMILGDKTRSGGSLEQRLFDSLAPMNRDWRRIAVTEAGEAYNQGAIAALATGTKVKRIEQYRGVCPYCKSIDGVVATVVSPDDPDKDGTKSIWVGKNNVGRSASPRKRIGDQLVERTPDEMYWLPSGLSHPNCFTFPGMPIYTDSGWRPISTIRVGDSVLTHKGRFRTVNWVLDEPANYVGKVVRFGLSFDGRNHTSSGDMTPEHPVLTTNGWVAAKDINAGDGIIALAKVCPTCGKHFVNPKFRTTTWCCDKCVPKSGKNQFSTDDKRKYDAEVLKTAVANKRRMKSMTVEQRREITAAARAAGAIKGYAHLMDPDSRHRMGVAASTNNYAPSAIELHIAEIIEGLGRKPELQYRIPKTERDSRGCPRYWWADMALVDEKIVIEIDGEPWHDRMGNDVRDRARDADMKSQGWTVLRFSSVDAKNNPYDVAEKIIRVAMNHSGEYIFSSVTVDIVKWKTCRKPVKLYNFGVDDDESYVTGTGMVVHNCRGRWLTIEQGTRPVDPAFSDWMDEVLGRTGGKK